MKAQETKSTSAKVDKNVVNKLTHTTNVKKDAYDAAAADASELQVKVDAITKEIKLKTSGKMKEMDDKINRNAKNIDILSAEISKLKVAIKTANRSAVIENLFFFIYSYLFPEMLPNLLKKYLT